ncbi:adenosylcobinamide hydrolase [Plasticicumulans lactativorans]|uniref:Adenosylcobinamide hydrolase n=1 Tax=Plasticicumulans lactativorans TaxID=1133106 RepID=A0A4V2SCQ5_9GAMM|nr:adenosylcobinamide hydrolase [Plasticicumulans lactativorans]
MRAVDDATGLPAADGLRVECDGDWLGVAFAAPRRCLSWAVHRPGLVQAGRVAWLQVRDADLGPEVDPAALLARRLQARGWGDAVGLLTACDVAGHRRARVTHAGVSADCVLTLGLGNGVRVGELPAAARAWRPGTINLVCQVSVPLALPALLEALSIATAARTAGVLALGWSDDPAGAPVSGTGTDCCVIACPDTAPGATYAGLHTAVGQALGAAVLQATRAAGHAWLARTLCPLTPSNR